jgi:hypothetical protein
VRIDGLGTPNLPLSPLTGAPAANQGVNAAGTTAAQAIQQAIQQEEQKGGGGGRHGGGHGAKNVALDAIDDIAARASLNIERQKTMMDRMREIEKMKAEMAAEDEVVGEKQSGEREEHEAADDDDARNDDGRGGSELLA